MSYDAQSSHKPDVDDLGRVPATTSNTPLPSSQTDIESPREEIDQTAITRFGQFLTQDAALIATLSKAARFIKSNLSVIVTGESGTGKDVVAQWIHNFSGRAQKPFVPVNVAALPETLAESILFGHERGAFTGAAATKRGIIESAEDGTVFFDEIGDLSAGIQAKLLRVLQNRTVMRVGATEERPVNARFVFATNCRLDELVSQGKFRLDLLYRIREASIELPTLRSRVEDIRLLGEHFAREYGMEYCSAPKRLSARSLQAMLNYGWPGNVRELAAAIKRAVILTDGEIIDAADLDLPRIDLQDASMLNDRGTIGTTSTINDGSERLLVRRKRAEIAQARATLEQSQGNISEAARRLGVSRPTLYSLLRAA